jgi:cyclophilin family peptidyl-prolyl cis-trans isomerase/HEAT repeat protein
MNANLVLLVLLPLGLSACATAPARPAAPPAPPRYEQQLAAILRLEDTRVLRDPEPPPVAAPPPAAPGRAAARAPVVAPVAPPPADLVTWLDDEDARVRRRAALAVGRVGLPEGVAPLVSRLDDPDPDVREMAAFALGLLGDRSAAAALTTALDDTDARVQGRAAEALGAIGAEAATAAIGALVAAKLPAAASVAENDLGYPLSPDVEAFRLGVYALARLKAWDAFAAAVLGPAGAPKVTWWPVAYAAQRIGDARAFTTLAVLSRRPGTETAAFAARGLGVLKDPRGVDVLLPMIDPGRHGVRIAAQAVRSLGQIGDDRAAPALIALLTSRDLDDNVRLEVVIALGVMRAPAAIEAVQDALSSRWPPLRGAAYIALASIDAQAFLTTLSSLDPDPVWSVRADLATAFGSLEPGFGVARLTAMLRDGDLRVTPRVLESLAKIKAPNLAAVLLEHLASPDPIVRGSAAALLGDVRPRAGDAALREAYVRARGDDTYVARAAALAALSKYGAEAAGASLREALSDPDWAVRRRAAELLVGLDRAAELGAMRPAPTPRGRADYEARALVSPAYSPQAFIETEKGTIQVELAVLDAPLTVANFLALVRRGYFDAATFHRVVPNFVVQDGDPRGDGEGGPGHTIRDEINTRPYLRGTVGMALDWADTGGSQWFVTHGPQPHLDGRYTVFGHVVSGVDVVDRLVRGDAITRVWAWDGVERIEGPMREADASRGGAR